MLLGSCARGRRPRRRVAAAGRERERRPCRRHTSARGVRGRRGAGARRLRARWIVDPEAALEIIGEPRVATPRRPLRVDRVDRLGPRALVVVSGLAVPPGRHRLRTLVTCGERSLLRRLRPPARRAEAAGSGASRSRPGVGAPGRSRRRRRVRARYVAASRACRRSVRGGHRRCTAACGPRLVALVGSPFPASGHAGAR